MRFLNFIDKKYFVSAQAHVYSPSATAF